MNETCHEVNLAQKQKYLERWWGKYERNKLEIVCETNELE